MPKQNEEQIREYVSRALPTKAETFLQLFFPDPQKATPLAELAQNQAVLPILIDIFKSGSFPQNPGLLMQRVTRLMWQNHSPYEQAEAVFARLAFTMLDIEQPLKVPFDYAADKVGKTLLDDGITVGYLVHDDGYISFTHPLIRDYFAACHVRYIDYAERLKPPKYRWWSPSSRESTLWDGTMIALAGIEDSDKAIRVIARVDPVLAQICAISGIELSEQSYQQIALQFHALLLGNQGQEAQEVAAAALGQLGSHVTHYLLGIVPHAKWQIRASVVEALGYTRDPAARPTLIDLLYNDPDYRVQAAAAAALGYIGGEEALQALRDKLNTPEEDDAEEESTPTLLLVNDDVDGLKLMGLILQRAGGFKLMLAKSGEEAVEMFKQARPTAIFMNKSMPGIDGYEATQIITALSPSTPVVIASCSAFLKPSIWSGATDLLRFPVLPYEVKATADAICWKYFNPQHNVIKQAIAFALGNMGTAEVIPDLKTLLADKHATLTIRSNAQTALTRIHGELAFEALFEYWEDHCQHMERYDLFRTLKKLYPLQIKQALLTTLSSKNWEAAVDFLPQVDLDADDGQILLQHPQAEARVQGVKTLTAHENEDIILQAFADEATNVRIEAVWASTHYQDERAVLARHQMLHDPEPAVRKAAVGALRVNLKSTSIPFLLELLSDEDKAVRQEVVSTLGYFNDAKYAQAVLQALRDEDVQVQKTAVVALRTIGDVTVSPALEARLIDSDLDVRREVALTLGALHAVHALPSLINILKDENKDMRRAAAQALGKMGEATAVPALFEALKEMAEDGERKDILEAIGCCATRDDLALLPDLLLGIKSYEAPAVIQIIAKTAQASDIPDLLAILNQFKSFYSVTDLVKVILSLDPVIAVPALINRLPEMGYIHEKEIVKLMVDTHPKLTVPAIIEELQNPTYAARDLLIDALDKPYGNDVVPVLIGLLNAPRTHTVQKAAETLGKLGDLRAVPALLALLHHEDRWVRYHAAGALGQIRHPSAVGELATALSDPDAFVGEGVARALRQINTKEALLALEKRKHQ